MAEAKRKERRASPYPPFGGDMSRLFTYRAASIACVAALIACSQTSNPLVPATVGAVHTDLQHTKGSGTTSTPLARATFSDPKDPVLKIKRISDDWQFE